VDCGVEARPRLEQVGFQRTYLSARRAVGRRRTPEGSPTGGPLVLLYSDDLDATVAAVEDAGGTIAEEPYPLPGGRRFTFFDPSGNRLGVWSTT
jgi:uncharacterized protein